MANDTTPTDSMTVITFKPSPDPDNPNRGIVKHDGHRFLPTVAYKVPARFAALAVKVGWADETPAAVPLMVIPLITVPDGIRDGLGRPIF